MSNSLSEHHSDSPQSVSCAVVTVSDTRTLETDRGGKMLVELLELAGHQVAVREIVPDEPERMKQLVTSLDGRDDVDAVLLTGGTGISHRDQTFETVSSLIKKPLPGYGELFRFLSYKDIGPAAMLSRAVGGMLERTILLTMPGSPAAVELAMEKLILPELGHLVREARR